MKITKQKAFPTISNKNICISIGSILAVQLLYEKLNFYDIFSKHKSKGLDLNSLLIGSLSYKLTENFSIKEAGKWLNHEESLDILNLERFHERVLYRTKSNLGKYGYSRDHRPDKLQLTVGISELANPINIPIELQ